MRQMIELEMIDEILKIYSIEKETNEKLSAFIKRKLGFNTKYVNWIDSVGVVTEEDFNGYSPQFIRDNFEDLGNKWFHALSGQVDFGIVLRCVRDEVKE